MGTIQTEILGGFNGAAGTVIGSNWKGISIATDEEIVLVKKYVNVLYAGLMAHRLYMHISNCSN